MKGVYFSEEHEMFRKAVREFVEKELAPHVDEWEEAEDFPRWVYEKLGELGYLSMCYPEEYGGQDCDYFFNVVLFEELTRCGAFGLLNSIGSSQISLTPVFHFGSEDIRKRFIVPVIQGKQIAAIAMTEAEAGSDVAAIRTKAEKTQDGWVINGGKNFTTNGTVADWVVFLAITDPTKGHRGMSSFLIEKGTPGFTASKYHKLGNHSSDTAELSFDNCLVPAENLLGEEGRGFYQMMWELEGERTLGAVGFIAEAQFIFEAAQQYVQERVQFGQTISSFQAIRHRFADMATELEATRQLAYYAGWLYMNGQHPIKESSMAKLMAAQVVGKIADEALQMYAGYGYMTDLPIERYWRDARLCRIIQGTDEIQREIIAGQLFPRVPKG